MFNSFLRQFVRWYKETTPCADCGRNYAYYQMDFDHIPERGQKLGQIESFIKADDKDALELEIAKCDVVCANCHRERTHQRGVSPERRETMRQVVTGIWASRSKSEKTRIADKRNAHLTREQQVANGTRGQLLQMEARKRSY